MEYKSILKKYCQTIIANLYSADLEVIIEKPKNRSHGEYAIPCFTYAKSLRKAPQVIAEEISRKIDLEFVESVTVVNGYINVKLNRKLVSEEVVNQVLTKKSAYGTLAAKDENVIVEYSSPNIAKPFHIGHIRTTIIGAALYRMYKKSGYNTIGINHLGDYGTQFGKLIVAIKNWGNRSEIEKDPIPELLKLYIKFHEEAEKDPAYDEEARAWFTKLENGNEEAYELWKWIREVSLLEFNRVYDIFGIEFDSLKGESFYSDKMDEIVKMMEEHNLLVKDCGAEIVELEKYNLPNALIKKKDGSTLYITRDLAAMYYRHQTYNFAKNIYVVGHQQELHFKQLFKIVDLMTPELSDKIEHVKFGMVSLEDGSLSTRSGRVLFLEDVVNKAIEKSREIILEKNSAVEDIEDVAKKIGVGALVFQELYVNRNKDYAFDWQKTLSFEGETGPYLQYTGVRISSIVHKYGKSINEFKANMLEISDHLWHIVVDMMSFSETLENGINKNDPSLIAKYAMDLAQDFNKFYSHEKIITDDESQTTMRMAITLATYYVLEETLRILGINIPNEM